MRIKAGSCTYDLPTAKRLYVMPKGRIDVYNSMDQVIATIIGDDVQVIDQDNAGMILDMACEIVERREDIRWGDAQKLRRLKGALGRNFDATRQRWKR